MEDGEGAVGVFVDPDPCLDVVAAMAVGRDRQHQAFVAHGIVVGDGALLLHAEDVVEGTGEGHEGGALGFRRHREAGVVAWQVELLEEAVGLGHVGDAGEPELLGQALLQGGEHAFRAPPCLGRVGRDQLDAELGQGAAELGRIVLVDRAAVSPNNNAYTAMHVGCHTDLVNWSAPAGYQLLHCLVNRAEGGQSIFVDGFSVAETLRQTDPDTFDLLASRPLPFRFHDEQSDIRIRAPLIAADERGNLVGVRFNLSLLDILDLPADTMDGVYQAYHKLAGLMRDPRFELRLRLAPGDLVAFDNHRVLHGRTAFDADSGRRHLQGCYVDRDELRSRLRVLEHADAERAA